VSAPTRASSAGRAYLDLRKLARENQRPVDELLQLYVLEAFLARLTGSRFADQLVLKGGVLLAAFDERRPTRDIDLQGQAVENDIQAIRATACEVGAIALDDGVIFDVESTTAEEIRDEEIYAACCQDVTPSTEPSSSDPPAESLSTATCSGAPLLARTWWSCSAASRWLRPILPRSQPHRPS